MPAIGAPFDLPFFARPNRQLARLLIVTALATGCADRAAEKQEAYDDALAAVDREKTVLRNMRSERERLLGEYQMHDFEIRVWSGQFAPHEALGVNLTDEFGDERRLVRFFYRHWPLDWIGQLDRLLALHPQLLPWYDRYAGDAHRRRLVDHYVRRLNTLADRLTLQQGRVRDAEEYARLLKPADVP
jgi:hypothetical protein